MQRLLILGCSKRKRTDGKSLPAIDRYDGPAFRVLRRYQNLTRDNGLCVYILSAKFGLISAKKPIRAYDQKMTLRRAHDLQASVAAAVKKAILDHEPSQVFVCAGKTYLKALGILVDNEPRISVASGGQGKKLACLKSWLHENKAA
jgi:hypothetical protein